MHRLCYQAHSERRANRLTVSGFRRLRGAAERDETYPDDKPDSRSPSSPTLAFGATVVIGIAAVLADPLSGLLSGRGETRERNDTTA
jgi:hypothetical protein